MDLVSAFVISVWSLLHKLGGPGLILIGVADNSVVPLPGSMDVFTIILSSHNRQWWFYYGAMATVGAVLGGYLTYRLSEKGGEETLEKRIGKDRAKKVYAKFQTGGRGFSTVFVGSILPPPFPIVPVLMAAGVLQYPRKKFVAALTAGRGIRFFAVAYIGHLYGESIIGFFSQYYKPVLYGLIGLAVLAAIGILVYLKWHRPRHHKDQPHRSEKKSTPRRKRVA